MVPVGYSGTPLAKKIGFEESSRAFLVAAPKDYARLVDPLPHGVTFAKRLSVDTNIAHLFVTSKAELIKQLNVFRKRLKSDAVVWVSWPKKSSGVATTVTEDTIREVALPLGFVDVKVCAVSEIWSGLKLVVRKELR
jgi:hypothetical protein